MRHIRQGDTVAIQSNYKMSTKFKEFVLKENTSNQIWIKFMIPNTNIHSHVYLKGFSIVLCQYLMMSMSFILILLQGKVYTLFPKCIFFFRGEAASKRTQPPHMTTCHVFKILLHSKWKCNYFPHRKAAGVATKTRNWIWTGDKGKHTGFEGRGSSHCCVFSPSHLHTAAHCDVFPHPLLTIHWFIWLV